MSVGIGFAISMAAFVYLIILIIRKLVDPTVAMGWTSMVGTVFLMGGLNLSFIGMTGLYIGNIFDEVKARPLYVISTILNREDGEQQ